MKKLLLSLLLGLVCLTGCSSNLSVSTNDSGMTVIEGLDKKVANGDIVVIDFAGKVDGVAFSGGTASNQQVQVGAGMYIDGFEEGMVGMEVGETKDVTCTFPDVYKNNPDLAGKEAIFTITIKAHYRIVEVK